MATLTESRAEIRAKLPRSAAAEAAIAANSTLDARIVLDFFSWTPERRDLIDFSPFKFPAGTPFVQIKQSYAVALIFCHSLALRGKYDMICTKCWQRGTQVRRERTLLLNSQ